MTESLQNSFKTDRHAWNVTPAQAREIQTALRKEIIAEDRFESVRYVAGVDVAYGKNRLAGAAAVVLSFPDLQLQEVATARRSVDFPYVPGLLSFREAPVMLRALAKLTRIPDLLLCDGHGRAHPRRVGIACHIGLLTGLPTIGVGKTVLVGTHNSIKSEKGSQAPLVEGDDTIGVVLRTRTGVKPIYVSVGHNISLSAAADYVIRCGTRYRNPEPIRWAHRLAAEELTRPN